MTSKKKTGIKKSTLAVTVFVTLLAVILIIAILGGLKNETPTKPTSTEYFKIDEASALGTTDPENQTLKIKMLHLKFTPIKGDAHDVHIDPGGALSEDSWPYYQEIKSNQSEYAEISYQTEVLAEKWKDGFNFTLRLWCQETSWNTDDERVTVYISQVTPL